MSLVSMLQIGRSSLLTHQAALGVAAGNTANVDTPGFAKRDAQLVNTPGGGVGIGAVLRRGAPLVEQRLLLARARLGAHQAKAEGTAVIERSYADGDSSIGARIDAFFAAMRALATAPGDIQLRNDVLSRAQALADAFNQTSTSLAHQREQANQALDVDVARVSELAAGIAAANTRIVSSPADSGERAEALDARQRMVDELSGLVDVRRIEAPNGSISLLLQGGNSLVSGGVAASLTATADPALGGLQRIDMVDASGVAFDITQTLRGGVIGGLLELRDDVLVDVGDRLDQLAYDIATHINTTHAAGFGADGVSGRNLFDPPGSVAGAAGTMDLVAGTVDNPQWLAAASSAATAVGGNDNLLTLISLADANVAAGGTATMGEEFAAQIASIGRIARSEADAETDAQSQVDQNLAIQQSQTGVSMDEELVDITRFQRAYQAGARIVSTVDEMYQTILQL